MSNVSVVAFLVVLVASIFSSVAINVTVDDTIYLRENASHTNNCTSPADACNAWDRAMDIFLASQTYDTFDFGSGSFDITDSFQVN